MSNTLTSKIIGTLKQEINFSDWWKSEEIEIPFFDNKKFKMTFMDFEPQNDPSFIAEADKALESFFQLTSKDRDSISDLVFKNCKDFIDDSGIERGEHILKSVKNSIDIWNFVYPSEIYLTRRPYKENDIYLSIACECEWEHEHGLQLVYRQGKKLTRISQQDGHLTDADAYGISDEEDNLLSKF